MVDERPTPDEEWAAAEAAERLRAGLGRLETREAAVLRLRFGLGDEAPMTLQEAGKRLGGYTRKRARQLERQGLTRLRAELT